MTDASEIEPELSVRERALAEQLQAARPVPGAAFRGGLSRHIADHDPGYGTRPRRLRLIASGYFAASALLLALAAFQAAGTL
jgi:hypothetical protein